MGAGPLSRGREANVFLRPELTPGPAWHTGGVRPGGRTEIDLLKYRVSQSSKPKVNADISGAIADIDFRFFVSGRVLMPILCDITITCVNSLEFFFRRRKNWPDFRGDA